MSNYKSNYEVVVERVSLSRIDALRAIMTIGGLSPQEARAMAESVPFTIKEGISYEEALQIKSSLDQVKVSCTILNSDTSAAVNFVTPHHPSSACEEKTEVYNEPYKDESFFSTIKETIQEEKEGMSLWEKIKIIGGILSVIVGIAIVYMAYTGKLDTVTNDIISNVSKDANPYIEMVQETTPFDDGRSYKEAFEQAFDSNKWSYFSSDEERIVQIVSRYDEYDLQITTQISLTPIDDSSGEYWIEPHSMRIDDYQLSTDEMGLCLLGIFSDEVSQTLNEIFAY